MNVPTEEESQRASAKADKMFEYYKGCKKRTWVIGVAVALVIAVMVASIPAMVGWFKEPTPPSTPKVTLVDEPLRRVLGRPPLPIPGKSTTYDVVEYYVYDATQEASWMWDTFLKKAGMEPQGLAIVSISGSDRERWLSRCAATDSQEEGDVNPDHPHVLFCAESQLPHVWLPQVTLRKVWMPEFLGMVEPDGRTVLQYRPAFAGAAVGVYAVGRYVIEELWQRADAPALPIEDVPLVATCFVGAWAGTANNLEATDIVAAVLALSKLSSPTPSQNLQALVDAFMAAYYSGRPLDCMTRYWPGYTKPASPSPSVSPQPLPTVSLSTRP